MSRRRNRNEIVDEKTIFVQQLLKKTKKPLGDKKKIHLGKELTKDEPLGHSEAAHILKLRHPLTILPSNI